MRFKYYLRGVGIGILFSTIVLMVAFGAYDSSASDLDIVERAKEMGMIWPEEEQLTEGAMNSEVISDEEDSKIQDNKVQNTNGQNNEPQDDKILQDNVNNASEDSLVYNPISDSPDEVLITVESGDVCRTIAEKLAEEGLVDDAESFRKYMGANNYAKSLHAGEFLIQKNLSYEEIAQILINR